MPLDHGVIGVATPPYERSWTSTDTLLYALGLGAGQDDSAAELNLTTENTEGIEQQVLPTFAVLAATDGSLPPFGDYDPAMLVHAEQSFELTRPLSTQGTVRGTAMVTGIHDKGSGALVSYQHTAHDIATEELLIIARGSVFIRGAGGFGGAPAPAATWREPGREPDHRVTLRTRADQALLYRLSGDRNPLHSDPTFAKRAGFARPILHGLCTYGVTGRALVNSLADGDPGRIVSMSGRFTSVVFPGDELTVSIWREGDTATFRTTTQADAVAIDRGVVLVRQTSGRAAG